MARNVGVCGMVSPEELYLRFQEGDNSAFEELVEFFRIELLSFIKNIVWDPQEANHLMIETFAQLAVGGKRFAGKSSIKTYLFAIGKNLAGKHMKERGKDAKRLFSYAEVEEALTDGNEGLDGFVEREENRRQLRESMRKLKDDHRAVLSLLYFEHMSYKEAGRAMGKSEKQIKGLAYRAKAALKRKLDEDGFSYTS
jgi:RNA polymerase sigma-70 factor (ECF subfamily)